MLLDDNTTETVVLICCKMGRKAEVEELRELSDERCSKYWGYKP